jgi:iron complex transport system ATP-binding protein
MSRPDSMITAQGISVGYGRGAVVEDLHLAIPEKSFTALMGANGSGKSTLLRTLAGLITPMGGTIQVAGRALSGFSTKELARQVSMLAQGPVAPEGLTVLDLVRQGRYPHRSLFGRWSDADDAACAEALRLTRMGDLAGSALDSLSGGQRQRAWIAMTLAQQSSVLLLDEPTTFLDLAHQIDVMELLVTLVRERGKTVVAVLHDLNQAARHADHMVLLKKGRIAAAGRPPDVMTADRIAQVFGVAAAVMPDPIAGTPMCVPLVDHRRADE